MINVEMEYDPFIYTTIIYLMLWIRFRKELVFTTFIVSAVYFMIACDGRHHAKAERVNESYRQ